MSVDFRVRDFAYPMATLRLRRFFEKSQWLPPEEIRPYQEAQLRCIVNQAYHHVPYYRRLFDESGLRPRDVRKIEHLPRLPLLSRETVRTKYGELSADNGRRFRPAEAHTSGTSGTPLRFLVDKPSNTLEFVYYWRHWSWAGYHLGDCFAELRYDFFMSRRAMMEKAWHFQPHLRRLLLNSVRLSRDRIGEYARGLRKYRPRFLHGLPTHLHSLSLFLHEAKMDDIELRAVFTGGETLMPRHRATIEKTFGCKVLDSYGHMERCVAVSQCPEGGYHVNSEYGILELAQKKRGNDGAVIGRIVGTSLHKMAMPFLRYELDDSLELYEHEKQCSCGRTLPLVKAIHGEKRDVIRTPDGREISWPFVAFYRARGVRFYQFIQEEVDRLVVRIVKGEDYSSETEKSLKLRLSKLFGEGMRVKMEHVSQEDLERDSSGRVLQTVSRLAER